MWAEAFLPRDEGLVLWVGLGLGLTLVLGRILSQAAARWAWLGRWGSWLLVVGGFVSVYRLCLDEPAGFRMLAIIGVVLLAMKAVVSAEERIAGEKGLTLLQWFAWAGAWPGMAPSLFAQWGKAGGKPSDDQKHDSTRSLFVRGLVWLAVGFGLLVSARLVFEASQSHVMATVLALVGLSLVLHFGIFNWLSWLWRLLGVPAYVLFPAPLYARSLGEFWGRRWNLPFTEMIQRAVYHPLAKVIGRPGAAVAGFFFSGLLHECAISVPVQQGYGWPMLYFVIHGGLVFLERKTRLGQMLERHRAFAHIWTLTCLALPMPILFHPPFLAGVVWPLVGIPS